MKKVWKNRKAGLRTKIRILEAAAMTVVKYELWGLLRSDGPVPPLNPNPKTFLCFFETKVHVIQMQVHATKYKIVAYVEDDVVLRDMIHLLGVTQTRVTCWTSGVPWGTPLVTFEGPRVGCYAMMEGCIDGVLRNDVVQVGVI